MKQQGVYIIHFEDEPYCYKIGRTTDLNSRLQQIAHGAYRNFPIVDHFIETDIDTILERRLHDLFSDNRIPRGLSIEWFHLTEDDIQFVRSIIVIKERWNYLVVANSHTESPIVLLRSRDWAGNSYMYRVPGHWLQAERR